MDEGLSTCIRRWVQTCFFTMHIRHFDYTKSLKQLWACIQVKLLDSGLHT